LLNFFFWNDMLSIPCSLIFWVGNLVKMHKNLSQLQPHKFNKKKKSERIVLTNFDEYYKKLSFLYLFFKFFFSPFFLTPINTSHHFFPFLYSIFFSQLPQILDTNLIKVLTLKIKAYKPTKCHHC